MAAASRPPREASDPRARHQARRKRELDFNDPNRRSL
jgi:hypothetical protein